MVETEDVDDGILEHCDRCVGGCDLPMALRLRVWPYHASKSSRVSNDLEELALYFFCKLISPMWTCSSSVEGSAAASLFFTIGTRCLTFESVGPPGYTGFIL